MSIPTDFAKFASNLLAQRKLTVNDLAAKLRCSPRSIQNILSGRTRPPEDLGRWFDTLGCDVAQRQRMLDTAALTHLPAVYWPRFKTLIQDGSQLRDIRGTMILCDQLYQDSATGKWVIAGTHNRWFSSQEELQIHNLQCYLRLQVEHPGQYPGVISCVDRTRTPADDKIWEVELPLNIPNQGLPVFEARVILPGLTVRCPVPKAKRENGKAYGLTTSLWLRVGNTEVASCPLDFIFTCPPKEADSDAKDSDDLPAPELR